MNGFKTKYGEGIHRILISYQATGIPTTVLALETYLKTMIDQALTAAKDELANSVCEGLHDGPGKGLKCRSCYDAENGVQTLLDVEAEIAAAKEKS